MEARKPELFSATDMIARSTYSDSVKVYILQVFGNIKHIFSNAIKDNLDNFKFLIFLSLFGDLIISLKILAYFNYTSNLIVVSCFIAWSIIALWIAYFLDKLSTHHMLTNSQ